MSDKLSTRLPEGALKLILSYADKGDHFYDTQRDFEKVILASGCASPVFRDERLSSMMGAVGYNSYKILGKAFNFKYTPPQFWKGRNHYFSILMGAKLRECLPYFFLAKRKSIYFFDAWDQSHSHIDQFIKTFSVDDVFISSQQATEKLNKLYPGRRYHWVPEGIDPAWYTYLEYSDKDIDVLQIGRRYDAYHNKIARELQSDGFNYLYENNPGEFIFPTRLDFSRGLARTKISICVTSDITHPNRAGKIRTMTNRYLQSMASKALVVGIKPPELDVLFDYNPIVEIDMADPVGQLRNILNSYTDYIQLIEKNYEIVRSMHTWENRWSQICNLLQHS